MARNGDLSARGKPIKKREGPRVRPQRKKTPRRIPLWDKAADKVFNEQGPAAYRNQYGGR